MCDAYFIPNKHLSGKETSWRLIMGDSVNSLHFLVSGGSRDRLFSTSSLSRKRAFGITTGLWCSWFLSVFVLILPYVAVYKVFSYFLFHHVHQESKSNSDCWRNMNHTLFGHGSLGFRVISHENTFFLIPDPTNTKELVTHHNPLFFLEKIKINNRKACFIKNDSVSLLYGGGGKFI